MFVSIITCSSMALAGGPLTSQPMPNGAIVLASRGGQPVVAAEITGSIYAPNDLLDVWRASGGEWKEEHFRTPELVLIYSELLALRRDRDSQSRLFAPQWCADRVLNEIREPLGKLAEDQLQWSSFVARYDVGPYVILVVRVPSLDPRRESMLWPTVLRRFGDGYRITFEVSLNSTVQFLGGLCLRAVCGELRDSTAWSVSRGKEPTSITGRWPRSWPGSTN